MKLPRSQTIIFPPTPTSTGYIIPQSGIGLNHGSLQHPRWLHITAWLANLRVLLIELYQSNVGLLLIAASQIFITLMSIAVKFLNELEDPVPTLELVFVRMLITYCCSVSYMTVRHIPHALLGPPEVRSLLVFRGISGFFGLFGIYYSLKYLSLSDTVVFTFLSPTTTAVAGFLFLRESLSRKEVFAGRNRPVLSLSGVVLIAQPQSLFGTIASNEIPEGMSKVGETVDSTTPTQRLRAVGVALLGVLGSTGAYISLRAIGTRAHTMHSLAFFSSYSVIVSSIGMLILRIPPVIPKRLSWCSLLAAVGIFGFIAQILLVMGLQRETASRGTLALYVQIIFATAAERMLFKVVPSYLSMLGTVIIMSSAMYVVLNKDTKRDAYKRIPQTTNDVESHELDEPQETSNREGTNNSIESPLLDSETLR